VNAARSFLRVLCMAWAASVAACASAPTPGAASQAPAPMGLNKKDPWEALNRKVFAFNDVVDVNLLQPVARTYEAVVPPLVRAGVSNFFGNLGDAWSAVNHLLQGKAQAGVEMSVRFMVNSTVGLFGILDPASEMGGLERRSEDFGQTLGRWGVGPGPYLVLPLLGPSTLRDASALPVDFQASPTSLISDANVRLGLTGVNLVQVRAGLLGSTKLLDQVAMDKYSFLRDAFLSRRRSLVYDGDPPEEPEEPEPALEKKAAKP
jgi:phospholipid-binding lipoprotein MlaA